MVSASQGGHALTFGHDALGNLASATGPLGTVSYAHDDAGRRTRMTYPGTGLYVDYDYLVTGEVAKIRENGATSGVGVLAAYGYDDLGRRTSLTRGNGTVRSYGYDPAHPWLKQLGEDVSGTAHDLTLGFSYNPAGQIAANTRSNETYSVTPVTGATGYTANGLNQYTQAGSAAPTYDARGNLTSAGGPVYAYTSENMLKSTSAGVSLAYDPMLRL